MRIALCAILTKFRIFVGHRNYRSNFQLNLPARAPHTRRPSGPKLKFPPSNPPYIPHQTLKSHFHFPPDLQHRPAAAASSRPPRLPRASRRAATPRCRLPSTPGRRPASRLRRATPPAAAAASSRPPRLPRVLRRAAAPPIRLPSTGRRPASCLRRAAATVARLSPPPSSRGVKQAGSVAVPGFPTYLSSCRAGKMVSSHLSLLHGSYPSLVGACVCPDRDCAAPMQLVA